MKYIVIFLLCLTVSFAQKQTIVQAEYFIDPQTKEGEGIPLNLYYLGFATVDIPWDSLPPIGRGEYVYVRLKGSGFIDNNGKQVPGQWSYPVRVAFPTKAVIISAEAKIIRPGLSYPLLHECIASDGSFDSPVEVVSAIIKKSDLQVDDTLCIRLQGKDEIWGNWAEIPIRDEHLNPVGIEENYTNAENLSISPNPVTTQIEISFPKNMDMQKLVQNGKIKIYNLLGVQVLEIDSIFESTRRIDVSGLPPGVYILRIGDVSQMFVKK